MVHEARRERRGKSRVECLFRHGSIERGRVGPEYRGYAAE